MRWLLLFPVFAALVGCMTSSTHMLGDEAKVYDVEGCSIEVFSSRDAALAAGLSEEVCRVESSSMFSIGHDIDTAVRRGAKKACECGVTKAYIVTAYQHEGPAKATMVGFK